jgi:hypothetical protein
MMTKGKIYGCMIEFCLFKIANKKKSSSKTGFHEAQKLE